MEVKYKNIYLDEAASSRPLPEVIIDIMYNSEDYWGNPSSQHSIGIKVRQKIEESRETIRQTLNIGKKDKIIFFSNATEALAYTRTQFAKSVQGHRVSYFAGCIDHPSLIDTSYTRLIPCNAYGHYNWQWLLEHIDATPVPDYALISTSLVNNEIGVIQNTNKLLEVKKQSPVPMNILFDCCQAIGHIPIDFQALGCDFMVFTSEKIGMPRGCAVLVAKEDALITPPTYGGHQENGFRPGTENSAIIISMGKRLKDLYQNLEEKMEQEDHLEYLLCNAIETACNGICDYNINKDPIHSVKNIISVTFDKFYNNYLVPMLDMYGVYCSTSSACSSRENQLSPVLLNLGLSEDEIRRTVRFSFSADQINKEVVEEFEKRLRKVLTSPLERTDHE